MGTYSLVQPHATRVQRFDLGTRVALLALVLGVAIGTIDALTTGTEQLVNLLLLVAAGCCVAILPRSILASPLLIASGLVLVHFVAAKAGYRPPFVEPPPLVGASAVCLGPAIAGALLAGAVSVYFRGWSPAPFPDFRHLSTVGKSMRIVTVALPLWMFGAFVNAVGFNMGIGWDGNPFDDYPFDRTLWLRDETNCASGNMRGHMAEDILNHHLRPSMTEAEIRSLLGRPESVWTHADIAARQILNARPIRSLTHFRADDFRITLSAGERFRAQDLQADRILSYYLGEDLGGPADRAWIFIYLDKNGRCIGGRLDTYT